MGLAYALDQANFRLVGVDVAAGTVTSVLRTGRYPFGLALSPDGRKAYVANVGMFEYSYVEGFDPANVTGTALPFPASAPARPRPATAPWPPASGSPASVTPTTSAPSRCGHSTCRPAVGSGP